MEVRKSEAKFVHQIRPDHVVVGNQETTVLIMGHHIGQKLARGCSHRCAWPRPHVATHGTHHIVHEREEGMTSGELRGLMFMARAIKANDLAGPRPHPHSGSLEELKQCPECQEWDKTYHATWERIFAAPLEEMVKELAFGVEWADNAKAKAAILPVANVLEKAIRGGELEIPEHRQTHKSHEEFLACDICQDWERRRDAI